MLSEYKILTGGNDDKFYTLQELCNYNFTLPDEYFHDILTQQSSPSKVFIPSSEIQLNSEAFENFKKSSNVVLKQSDFSPYLNLLSKGKSILEKS